jgi:intein-encoded DNA endonuclease-like protein
MQKPTHIHCEKVLRRQILQLYKEGWHIANIASIVQCKPDVVLQVLKDKGILM